ncbi:MAG: T9SS type A sorting domain-containing protein, partial [Bacteroidota bacterium]
GTQPQAFRYSACYVSGTPPTTPSIIENTGTLDAGTGTSFQWYENGVAIPGATGQQLIPQNNAYYSVQTIDANGCPSDTSSDFYFGTTGVAQITAASLSMTPNPTQGVVELHIPGNAGSTAYVTVVDQSGRVVLETAAAQRLDLQQLPDGIYYVRLKTADQTFVSRLAVVR